MSHAFEVISEVPRTASPDLPDRRGGCLGRRPGRLPAAPRPRAGRIRAWRSCWCSTSSPPRPSLLSDALAKATTMKVAQAEDGVRVEPEPGLRHPARAPRWRSSRACSGCPRSRGTSAGRTFPSTSSSVPWRPTAAGRPSAWSSPEPPPTARPGSRRSAGTAGSPSRRTPGPRASARCPRARSTPGWSTSACPCRRSARSWPGWSATPTWRGASPFLPRRRGAAVPGARSWR